MTDRFDLMRDNLWAGIDASIISGLISQEEGEELKETIEDWIAHKEYENKGV